MGSDSVGRRWLRFVLRYVEFTLVLVIGMVLLSMAVGALRAAAGFSYPVDVRAAMASVEMGLIMTLVMIIWLRIFRFGWPTTLEMAATMLVPALIAAVLTQTGVIGVGPAMVFEHVAMFVLMLAVMLRRREEFMARRGARQPVNA